MMEAFRFKKFSVSHQNSFKIGADAVLLGALTPVTADTKRLLDIGTGSGVIALMLLQRGISSVIGIEIDPMAASEATENVRKSIWSKQMKIVCADFCDPTAIRSLGFFDLIVSNPPFFSNSLKSPDHQRNATRHNDGTLPFELLIQNAISVLSENGYFSLILPVPEAELFVQKAASYNLFPIEIHHIFSKPRKPESRQILVLKKQSSSSSVLEKPICIYQEDGVYSEEYKRITADFYLNFS
jgi:tRNA1Val (adenine37-N6)-methyltransferase